MADDELTVDERRTYLKRMRPRYERAERDGRRVLPSEMEAVTGLHRKSLLRLLHALSLERQPRSRTSSRPNRVNMTSSPTVPPPARCSGVCLCRDLWGTYPLSSRKAGEPQASLAGRGLEHARIACFRPPETGVGGRLRQG